MPNDDKFKNSFAKHFNESKPISIEKARRESSKKVKEIPVETQRQSHNQKSYSMQMNNNKLFTGSKENKPANVLPAKHTKTYKRPFDELVYMEACLNAADANKREAYERFKVWENEVKRLRSEIISIKERKKTIMHESKKECLDSNELRRLVQENRDRAFRHTEKLKLAAEKELL